MTRAAALENLNSRDSLLRLEAARALADRGVAKDRVAIGRALAKESDPWVRRELGVTIRAISRVRSRHAVSDLDLDARIDELRAAMTEEVSERLLHELRPLIGSAKLAATREVENYESSDTRASLDRVSDLLEAMGLLNRASMAPTSNDEFDMAEAAARLLRAHLPPDCAVEMRLAGPQPSPVTTSRALFEIAVGNGIRNALESVATKGEQDPCDGVVVNWGTTDADHWLAVVDEGIGVPTSSDALFAIGESSKSSGTNFGLGLAIARRAARSMGGDVTLKPRESSGAVFELRWPRHEGSDATSNR